MREREPSRTAYGVARHRALHQILEGGRVFSDPLALRILGADPEQLSADAAERPDRRLMRLFIAMRSRFADDTIAAAVAIGTRQVVLLGAGLDTFAYRHPYAALGIRVFEVDHPATQLWKRRRLGATDITVPPSVSFVGVDFESDDLGGRLLEHGFDPSRGAVCSWLGVVPYLTEGALWSTLGFVASLSCATVVFDYSEPPEQMPALRREQHERVAAGVAALGEPWLTYLVPGELHDRLRSIGLGSIEDLDSTAFAHRYLGVPLSRLPRSGAHLIAAGTSVVGSGSAASSEPHG